MKRVFLCVLLTLISLAAAHGQEVLIDDFEDGDVSDWEGLWEVGGNFVINASTSSHTGNHSLLLEDLKEGDAVRFAKQNLGIDLDKPFSEYNLSFWYRAECEGPANFTHRFYLSDEAEFAFSAVIVESGDDMVCGEWMRVNERIGSFETVAPFSLDSTHLGSIVVENWHRRILYDDIKLVPFDLECVSEWSCEPWSECDAGLRRRECTDLNSCGNISGMPETEGVCGIELELIEPDVPILMVGEMYSVSVRAMHGDEPAENLTVSLLSFNSTIPLVEEEPGVYSVTIVPEAGDAGSWNVSFRAGNALYEQNTTWDVLNPSEGEIVDLIWIASSAIKAVQSPWVWILVAVAVAMMVVAWKGRDFAKKVDFPTSGEKPKRKKEEKDEVDEEGLHEVKI